MSLSHPLKRRNKLYKALVQRQGSFSVLHKRISKRSKQSYSCSGFASKPSETLRLIYVEILGVEGGKKGKLSASEAPTIFVPSPSLAPLPTLYRTSVPDEEVWMLASCQGTVDQRGKANSQRQ